MNIKELKSIIREKICGDGYDAKERAEAVFNACCEYAKKFRWHDLRKNPEDLPKQNKNVMFATTDGCVQEGEWNYTCWIQYRWTTRRNNDEVVAWKEIEPFEEK